VDVVVDAVRHCADVRVAGHVFAADLNGRWEGDANEDIDVAAEVMDGSASLVQVRTSWCPSSPHSRWPIFGRVHHPFCSI